MGLSSDSQTPNDAADPSVLPAPFTWKCFPAAAWAGACLALINLSLEISLSVCLSVCSSTALCLMPGCIPVPRAGADRSLLGKTSGYSQWSSTAPSPAARLGARNFAGSGISLAFPHHSRLILPVRASLSFPQITSCTPLSRADFVS